MGEKNRSRYVLAEGTQVREEDFGLLFYTREGPRLFFMSSGDILDETFFDGDWTLLEWLELKGRIRQVSDGRISGIQNSLGRLTEKEVIRER